VPAPLTELLIAGTIVAGAARVLLYGRSARPRIGREGALAALCGLVHGLGIAGAMRAVDVDGRPDLVMLAGFNIGVEGAQLAAVLLAVAATAIGTRVMHVRTADPISARLWPREALAWTPRLVAGALGLVGTGWMVERMAMLW
jgi:hypothetical protein